MQAVFSQFYICTQHEVEHAGESPGQNTGDEKCITLYVWLSAEV
jgi:hypothetical protein